MSIVIKQMLESAKTILISKREMCYLGAFSLLFSAAITMGQKIVYSGNIFGNYLQNYIMRLEMNDILILLIYFFITFVLMFIINLSIKFLERIIIRPLEVDISIKTKRKYWIIGTFVLFICWLPYLISNLPGAIYADAYSSIYQGLGLAGFHNHHPILYSMIVKVLLDFGMLFGDINTGLTFYTIVQMLIMATVLGYSLSWMYRHRVSRVYIFLAGIAFAVYPLFPFYAVAMWKDTFFSLALLLYSLFILDVILSKGESVKRFWGAFHYVALSGFVICLRNNGIYIAIICTIILAVIFRKQLLNQLKLFLIGNLVIITISVIILFPVMNYLKINSPFAESIGIPLQQVSRVVVFDGNMSDEQAEIIEKIIPLERIKEVYTPCIVDRVKWDPSFNNEFLKEHKREFLTTWFNMFWNNKQLYIDAFLLETAGFWCPNFGGVDRPAYLQIGVWPAPYKDQLGIIQADLFNEWFGFSFTEIARPKNPIPEATFVWLFLASLTLALCRNRKNSMVYLPSILLWLTILIATPLAMSLRYIYVFVLMLPFLLVFPLLFKRQNSNLLESEKAD